jgi:hypothetical protein
MHTDSAVAQLQLVGTLLRVGLGLVWLLEGLLPKLLWPDPQQIALLASRLPIALPAEGMITTPGSRAMRLRRLAALWMDAAAHSPTVDRGGRGSHRYHHRHGP